MKSLTVAVAALFCLALPRTAAASSVEELVLPTPQEVLRLHPPAVVRPGATQVIFDPDIRGKSAQLGANWYLRRQSELNGWAEPTVEDADATKIRVYCGLTYSSGVREKLNGEVIRLPEQGYAIRVMQDDPDRVRIVVAGSDLRGMFYGFCTLAQLLESDGNGGAIQNLADINDYPVWAERYASDDVEWGSYESYFDLASKKISGFAWQYRGNWRAFTDTPAVRKNLQAMKTVYDLKLMDFMFLIHLYITPDDAPKFDVSNENDVNDLIERLRLVASHRVNTIMICVDDHTPRRGDEYTFFSQQEAAKFDNSIGKAHGFLMKRLYNALAPDFPNLRLAMVGAPYSLGHGVGKPSIDKYVTDWAAEAPGDVFWVWTGPVVCSQEITKADYDKMAALIGDHGIFLWDNSNGFDGPMARWETRFYPEMVFDNFGILYLNDRVLFRNSRWQVPYTMSANAYLWNPEAYDADSDYRKVLRQYAGEANVAPLMNLRKHLVQAGRRFESGDRDGFEDVLKSLSAAVDQCMPLKNLKGERLVDENVLNKLKLAREFAHNELPAIAPGAAVEKVTLDGVIDGDEWRNAAVFELRDRTGKEDASPVTGRMMYDGEAVYLAFDVPADTANLKKLERADGELPTYLSPDNVEIYLQPSPSGKYVHLGFDYAGNRFDEIGGEGGFDWDADWQCATAVAPDGWSAELRIPVLELERVQPIRQARGVRWLGNFHRVGDGKAQSWSLGGAGFHTPQFFGEITFK